MSEPIEGIDMDQDTQDNDQPQVITSGVRTKILGTNIEVLHHEGHDVQVRHMLDDDGGHLLSFGWASNSESSHIPPPESFDKFKIGNG